MTLFNMMDKLAGNSIFAKPFNQFTIFLTKYNETETSSYLPGMVYIGQVDYDIIDDEVANPRIDMENDTLTQADKAMLKEVFNL